MKTKIKLIGFCLIFLTCLIDIGIAGNRHHNIPDTKYLEYGTKFECVKKVVIRSNEKIVGVGSCVFINSTTALTSAHMVSDSDIVVFITDNNDNNDVCVEQIIAHKEYTGEFGKGDIAILKIKDKNPYKISAYPELYRDRDELGKLAAFGGFGITGTGLKGYSVSDSKLRFGTNIVDEVNNNLLCCKFSRESPSILEFIITPGDSGGGMFIDAKLAGINSCIAANDRNVDGNYGDESCHTRVSDFIDWIESNSK